MRYSLNDLNLLTPKEFVRVIGPVFERSPWIAEAVLAQRPFSTLEQLHRALCDFVRATPLEGQIALIRAHPDLGARAALTAESAREQAAAGLRAPSVKENVSFALCILEYREKFGFPFVICARLNDKDAIRAEFKRRATHSREEEIQTALEEIFKIADLRLRDIVNN